MSILFLAVDKRDFSDIENRELAKFPVLWDGASVNNGFYADLDNYYSDAFPFRDEFLLVNRRIQAFYTALSLPGEDDGVVFIATNVADMGNNPYFADDESAVGALGNATGGIRGGASGDGAGGTGTAGTNGAVTGGTNSVGIIGTDANGDGVNDDGSLKYNTGDGDTGAASDDNLIGNAGAANSAPGDVNAENSIPGDAGVNEASGIGDAGANRYRINGIGTGDGDAGAASDNNLNGDTGAASGGANGNIGTGAASGAPASAEVNTAIGGANSNIGTGGSVEDTGAASGAPTSTEINTASGAPTNTGLNATNDIFEVNESTGVSIVGGQAFEIFVFSESRTIAFAGIIDEIAGACGVPAYMLTPPSCSEMYLPDKYRSFQNEQKPAFNLLSSSLKNVKYIDLYDIFMNARGDYVYFKTDHHWTVDGAFLAYQAFMEAAGGVPVPRREMREGRIDDFLGSLYRQIYKDRHSSLLEHEPDFVRYYEPLYATEVVNYSDIEMTDGVLGAVLETDMDLGANLYNVFFGGDMKLLHMRSSIANGRSIVVIRDSFGHAFIPFLANNYEHVYAIEPRYFESFPLAEFIAEHKIDELLFLNHSILITGRYWYNWIPELAKLI